MRVRNMGSIKTPFALATAMFRRKSDRSAPPSPSSACSTRPGSEQSDALSADELSEHLPEAEEEREAPGVGADEDEEMHMRWVRVLGSRQVSELTHEEIAGLLSEGGVPLKHRHALWSRWCRRGGAALLVRDLQSVPLDVAAQIDADVPRTQPQLLGPAERDSLRRVLRAVAAENPSRGYCQGLNNVAAVFVILGFDEDAALQGVLALLQGCCPAYHDRDLGGLRRDAKVLEALVRRVLPPRAWERLEALDVPLELLVSDHFLTLASRSWPLSSTARLWDVLLSEGQPALFASFLALLELYLPEAHFGADDEDAPELVSTFRQAALQGATQDIDTVMQHTRRLIPLVHQGMIDEVRAELA